MNIRNISNIQSRESKFSSSTFLRRLESGSHKPKHFQYHITLLHQNLNWRTTFLEGSSPIPWMSGRRPHQNLLQSRTSLRPLWPKLPLWPQKNRKTSLLPVLSVGKFILLTTRNASNKKLPTQNPYSNQLLSTLKQPFYQ